MKIIQQNSYETEKHSFLFPAGLTSPICLMVEEFRSEIEYDADRNAKIAAFLAILQSTRQFAERKLYAVMAEQNTARVRRLRSHKGMLPLRSPLRQLEHRDLEVSTEDGTSRLGVVISLERAIPIGDVKLLLSIAEGVLVVSHMAMDDMCDLASVWMSGSRSRFPSLDFEAIAASLVSHPYNMVLRHFAADNGRSEMIVLIYNQDVGSQDARFFMDGIAI